MYIGDVGQNRREEINFQPAGSRGGENYGWKVMEGTQCFSSNQCTNPPLCNAVSLTDPIYDYATGANCTVVGGYVYRGCAIPDLAGTYFFADYCSARIWSFEYDGQNRTNFQERTAELRPATGATGRITSFGEDDRGEIYIVARNGIYKIVAGGTPSHVNLGFGTMGGNGEEPLFEVCGLLTPGLSAEFILRRAAPTAAASLLLSTSNNPTLFPPIGMLVPIPAQLFVPAVTDMDGRVQFTVNGVAGPATAFGQWIVLDPLATRRAGVLERRAAELPVGSHFAQRVTTGRRLPGVPRRELHTTSHGLVSSVRLRRSPAGSSSLGAPVDSAKLRDAGDGRRGRASSPRISARVREGG